MVEIRAATPDDAPTIRAVLLDAFPTQAEADLVDQLVADGDAVVSLVAVEGETTIGHVLFSRMEVFADGRRLDALGLAPVAVLRSRQLGGIGSMLIEAGLHAADKAGVDIVFVLGEPAYYGRFEFSAEAARPYESPYAGPYFQALWLRDRPAELANGTAAYAPAFSRLS